MVEVTKKPKIVIMKISLIILAILIITVIALLHYLHTENLRDIITYEGTTYYFNGRKAAIILRYDDYSLVVCNQCKGRWFKSAIEIANKYGIKVTIAVITRYPPRYLYLTPFRKSAVRYLVKISNFNEIASHTRWHRYPPRTPEDVIGSFVDIEYYVFQGRYKIMTYIYPYGAYDHLDVLYEKEFGIPVAATTKVAGVLVNPYKWNSSFWHALPISVSLSYNMCKNARKFISLIKALILHAIRNRGVIIILTHPTALSWPNETILKRCLTLLFSIMYKYKEELWFTTYGELYSYIMISKNVKVYGPIIRDVSNNVYIATFRICLEGFKKLTVWFIPISLRFIVVRGFDILRIIVDNSTLKEADFSNVGYRSHYREFYRVINKYDGKREIIVSLVLDSSKCKFLKFILKKT